MNRDRLTWIGRTDSGIVRQRLYERDIGTLLMSPLDPKRKEWDAAIRKEGAFTGRFIDPHWYGLAADGKALAFRQVCDAACAELEPTEMLMLDLELVSFEYVRRLLNGAPGNRGLVGSHNTAAPTGTQAKRQVTYTNMPFQDATVVPFADIADAGLHWYYQRYYGDMSEADGDAVALEILRWMDSLGAYGYASKLHPFYDGISIASDQRDGGWFTAERIPGVFASQIVTRNLIAGAQPLAAMRTKDDLRAYYTELARAV